MKRALLLVFVAVALGGCAATVKRGQDVSESTVRIPLESSRKLVVNISGPPRSIGSGDWEAFKGEWRGAFRRNPEMSGIAFEPQEGPAKPTGELGTLLSIYVDDYRYLTPGARYGFGVMTGNAYIEAVLTFSDLANGARFGVQTYNTSSSAWEGVFSAMTEKQIDAIVTEIARDMRRRPATSAGAPVPEAPSQSVLGAAPVPARATIPASPPPSGTHAYDVERMPAAKACHSTPKALLTAKGPGFENYSVACTNGDAISVRCEYGTCRVLK